MNRTEYMKLKRKADKVGLTVSAYARIVLLGGQIRFDLESE